MTLDAVAATYRLKMSSQAGQDRLDADRTEDERITVWRPSWIPVVGLGPTDSTSRPVAAPERLTTDETGPTPPPRRYAQVQVQVQHRPGGGKELASCAQPHPEWAVGSHPVRPHTPPCQKSPLLPFTLVAPVAQDE
ncbi:hypothetical protein [Streptomyces uncialis]|uniref:hypothetical protein n=1 Tax=Streptomyces uncialis TaxID=1048205 RepID=UPI00093F503A|nr:hypothetical protein [Streptomyces uncialis]